MFFKRQGIWWLDEQLLASREQLFSMALIIIHYNDVTAIMLRMYIGATVSSVLMKVCTVPWHDRDHINVMLVLQSCTDSVHILPGSPGETLPTSSDGTYDGGNIKIEEEIDIKEEGEVNVKTDNAIGSEEEECIGITGEEYMYSKGENEEQEEDIDTTEEEYTEVKEEVSWDDAV